MSTVNLTCFYQHRLKLFTHMNQNYSANLELGLSARPIRMNSSYSDAGPQWHSQCCRWRRSPGRWLLWSGRSAPYFSTNSSSALHFGSDKSDRDRIDTLRGLNFNFRQLKKNKKIPYHWGYVPSNQPPESARSLHVTRGWPPSPGSLRSGLCPRQTPSPPAQSGCLSHYCE